MTYSLIRKVTQFCLQKNTFVIAILLQTYQLGCLQLTDFKSTSNHNDMYDTTLFSVYNQLQ